MARVVDASDEQAATIATDVLRGGGIVVLPTDTVYGLAACANDHAATQALFDRKGRDATVPVAVLCADASQALGLGREVSRDATSLAAEHWPGALTVVIRRRADLGWSLGEPVDTIGVRCPDHDLVRAIAAEVGPLATTSANRHGSPTPTTARAAAESLTGDVDLIVDGGVLRGTASTVVDATGRRLRLLRAGSIDLGTAD